MPVAVRTIGTAATLMGGYYGFCALLSTSHVDCWGNGTHGELGNGAFNDSDVPGRSHGRSATPRQSPAVPTGAYCALLSTGKVDCWGYGGEGSWATGPPTDSDVPVVVTGLTGAKAVASR